MCSLYILSWKNNEKIALSVCWLKCGAPATTADGRSLDSSGLSWTSRLVLPAAKLPSTCSVPSVPRVGRVGSFGVAPLLSCLRCTRRGLLCLFFPSSILRTYSRTKNFVSFDRPHCCVFAFFAFFFFFQIERSSRPSIHFLSNRYIERYSNRVSILLIGATLSFLV